MRRMVLYIAVSLGLIMVAVPATQAQMLIESLDGPVTQNEIDAYKAFMRRQRPIPDNFGNRLAHHTGAQALDSLGLMYEVSGDPEILDIFVNWADTALHGRNDPDTGLIAWTGDRELIWPVGARPDGTAVPSTGAEQGYVMGHILFCAQLILQNPAIWNTPVSIGDPFGFGVTYRQRAETYVRECDRTEDTFILKWFLSSSNEWRFPAAATGYDGSTWFGRPFPWNQQWMLNQALIRLAECHTILEDDPDRVYLYDAIVQRTFDWWLSRDLTQVLVGGFPTYLWHYVIDAPNRSIEDTGHAAFDLWGLWLAYSSGRYTIPEASMTRFANTLMYRINLGGGQFAKRIDGGSGTQNNLQPPYLYLAKFIPDLYGVIANADLPSARNTAIYAAGILWVKNARDNGMFPTELLAFTPPMGWNSWNRFRCRVSDQIVRAQADAMVTNPRDLLIGSWPFGRYQNRYRRRSLKC